MNYGRNTGTAKSPKIAVVFYKDNLEQLVKGLISDFTKDSKKRLKMRGCAMNWIDYIIFAYCSLRHSLDLAAGRSFRC